MAEFGEKVFRFNAGHRMGIQQWYDDQVGGGLLLRAVHEQIGVALEEGKQKVAGTGEFPAVSLPEGMLQLLFVSGDSRLAELQALILSGCNQEMGYLRNYWVGSRSLAEEALSQSVVNPLEVLSAMKVLTPENMRRVRSEQLLIVRELGPGLRHTYERMYPEAGDWVEARRQALLAGQKLPQVPAAVVFEVNYCELYPLHLTAVERLPGDLGWWVENEQRLMGAVWSRGEEAVRGVTEVVTTAKVLRGCLQEALG